MSNSNGKGGMAGALDGLAVILCIGATVFVAPHVWQLVAADLWRELRTLYAEDTATWLHLGARIAVWPLTYFVLRIALGGAVTAFLLFLAWRRM
ncbi:MAG: hypothetical protein AAFX62_16595 [Pseudomonadota bacterium]